MVLETLRPLHGLRILDFSLFLPGPYATSMMAAFGAEVIKVEPPAGDPVRRMSPVVFNILNRGKQSICADLRDAEQRAALVKLATQCNALIEGFRPRTLERMGLGPEHLITQNPALVYTSISGFGWSGPEQNRAAHDLNFLALSGYFAVASELEPRPSRPQVRLADLVAGQTAAMATVMALMQAQRTGRGCHVDASIFDAMTAWTGPMMLGTPPEASPHSMPHVMADSALYVTADDQWLSFGTLEDKFWQNFVNAIKDVSPELDAEVYAHRAGRDRNKQALANDLSDAIRRHPMAFWLQRLDGVDTAVAPVLGTREVLGQAQVQARGLITPGEDAQVRFPVLFNGQALSDLPPAPSLGQHNQLLETYA